jgi:hypothetical protein
MLLIAAIAAAQSGTSTIAGIVNDPTGSPVPAAKIRIVNEQTGSSINLETNAALVSGGLARAGNLPDRV